MVHVSPLAHRRINDALSAVVILLALYILMWPLLPGIAWWLHHQAPFISKPPLHTVNSSEARKYVPQANTLYIPALDMKTLIHEGDSMDTLNQGVWHRPHTSNPELRSNTVLVGHRTSYAGNGIFYNLDKIHVGDQIIIYWEHKTYSYRVVDSRTVSPNDSQIESASDQAKLTLYTCTPIWTAKNRLVVIANLEHVL